MKILWSYKMTNQETQKNKTSAIEALTVEVINERSDELKEVLFESIKQTLQDSSNGYFNSINSRVKEVGKQWVEDSLKGDLIEYLNTNKETFLSKFKSSFDICSVNIGSAFLTYMNKQLENSWDRNKIFDAIFEKK